MLVLFITIKGRCVVELNFKYNIGQKVFYENEQYEILSRHYMETKNAKIIKYNLRAGEEFIPNVWESDIKTLQVIK